MGQCFAPPYPRPPSFSEDTCTPKSHRGNLLAPSATWAAHRASCTGHAETQDSLCMPAWFSLFKVVNPIEFRQIYKSSRSLWIQIVSLHDLWFSFEGAFLVPDCSLSSFFYSLNLHGTLQKMAPINQHSWTVYLSSLLCAAGPNPDRDQAVVQQCSLRHSTLCGRNPSTDVSGKCLPPLRA